jgi:hypothetical protein
MLLSLMDRLLLSMEELITDEEPLSSELVFRDECPEEGLPAERVLRMDVVRLGTSGGTRLLPCGPHSDDVVEVWLVTLVVEEFIRAELTIVLLLTGRGAAIIVVGVTIRRD